jgi:hypothetical protein
MGGLPGVYVYALVSEGGGAGDDHGDAGDRESVSVATDAVGAGSSTKVRC